MLEFIATDAYRSPLPMIFELECHPTGSVAREAGGIRRLGNGLLRERPSYSSAAPQGVLYAIPESIVLEGHVLDKDLHPRNQPLCHRRPRQQPQGLDAAGQHGEKGQPSNRMPVSHAEVFDAGFLFPKSYPFFHSPSAHVCPHDAPRLSDTGNVFVGEQDHVFGPQARDDDHKEAAGLTGQPHGSVAEADRAGFHLMGFLVDVRHFSDVGLIEARGQVAHEDGPVVADEDVAGSKLPDAPGDAEAMEDPVEVGGIEASVEEPGGVETDAGEDLQHSASDEVVEIAVLGVHCGVGVLPQGKVPVAVIRGVDLERGETVSEAFVRVAGVADGGETIEILAVALDEVGGVHGDERHSVCVRRAELEPGVSQLSEWFYVQIDPRCLSSAAPGKEPPDFRLRLTRMGTRGRVPGDYSGANRGVTRGYRRCSAGDSSRNSCLPQARWMVPPTRCSAASLTAWPGSTVALLRYLGHRLLCARRAALA